MDGSVSTLALIFATAGLTGLPIKAFYAGLTAVPGAGISRRFAETLSDDGLVTGCGNPGVRRTIKARATAPGPMLHTLSFLITHVQSALHLAYRVVVFELPTICFMSYQ